tara:strand:+ start:278 stop:862 length:585 start_codon:yes stop_codon:yes gene_type:complete
MEVTEAKSKFKKQLIAFNEKSYNEALGLSRLKLKLLAEAIQWCNNHIEDIDLEKFVENMPQYFLSKLRDTKPELQNLGINKPEKIADLLDINVNDLVSIESRFNKVNGYIKIVKGKAVEDVDVEVYKVYTRDEEENQRKKIADDLIVALENAMEFGINIQTNVIQQATSSLVQWWPYDNRGFRYNWNAFSRRSR